MTERLYFAYGSNLSTRRLLARISSARAIKIAQLPEHQLAFHMPSKDGSSKCDAHYTGTREDSVWGIVYRITVGDKSVLDSYEGLGKSYGEKTVTLHAAGGGTLEAFTYHALEYCDNLSPYCWYLEHVLRGAHEHSLPLDYIAAIESTQYISDPDNNRRNRELLIY